MKKIALLCFSLCMYHMVHAGPLSTLLKKRNQQHLYFIQMLTAGYTNTTAAKATGLKERIIAESHFAQGDVDSTTFTYTAANHNGSKYDYNALEYPTDFVYTGDPAIENLNGYHTKPYVFADTMLFYIMQQGSVLQYYEYNFTYDNNNNITGFDDIVPIGASTGGIQYFADYNQQNNITDLTVLPTTNGAPDTSNRRFFTYNQNQLSADSTYNNIGGPVTLFQLSAINTYTYDNAGNLTGVTKYSYNQSTQTTIPQYQYINTYTTDNRLKTSSYGHYNGNQLQVEEIDSFGYTSNVPFYTYWKETSPQAQSSGNVINYHTTLAGTVDSMYGSIDTGGANPVAIKVILNYDNYNNPVTGNLYYGNTSVPSETYRYYYETYESTAVQNITANKSNVQVYPNPANNTLYIAGLTVKDNATINLVNTVGQLIMTQTANGNGIQNVPLSNLAPGTYILNVVDAAGNKLHSQTIVKQ